MTTLALIETLRKRIFKSSFIHSVEFFVILKDIWRRQRKSIWRKNDQLRINSFFCERLEQHFLKLLCNHPEPHVVYEFFEYVHSNVPLFTFNGKCNVRMFVLLKVMEGEKMYTDTVIVSVAATVAYHDSAKMLQYISHKVSNKSAAAQHAFESLCKYVHSNNVTVLD